MSICVQVFVPEWYNIKVRGTNNNQQEVARG